MTRFRDLGLGLAGFCAALFFSVGTYILLRAPNLMLHADGVLTRSEVTLSKVNATVSNLDKATKVWSDAAKSEAGDISDTMLQVRGTLSAGQDAFSSIPPVAEHLNKTADALTETAQQASLDLRTLDSSFDALQPLLADSDRTVNTFNALLESKDLSDAIRHTNVTMEHVDAISEDAQKVADKVTADYLKPVKWYMRPVKYVGDIWDIGAAIARHSP